MAESQLQFLGYRVTNLAFSIEDSYGSSPEQLIQKINVETRFDPVQKHVAEVLIDVSLSAASKNLEAFVKMKGLFKGSSDMDDALFRKLSTQNAPAILFPIARALLASSTGQAGIPPLILPIANFVPDAAPPKA